MHDEPQISNAGEWGDATIETNTKGIINYSCRYCGILKRKKSSIIEHITSCKLHTSSLKENIDYVQCKICNFHSKKIAAHIKNKHNLSINDYKEKYSKHIICSNSSNKYSASSLAHVAEHGSWVANAKKNNIDLSEINARRAATLRTSLMNNPKERERRSKVMIALNDKQQKDPEFIKLVSETAKKTSARPEIIKQRTAQLRKWEAENPEKFQEQCINSLLRTWFSNPEKKLNELLPSLMNCCFVRGQFAKDEIFTTKSKRKQLDFVDLEKNIYLEFDGVIHFKPYLGPETLNKIREKDANLNKYILKNNFTLIRIGYDQWVAKNTLKNSYFVDGCLQKVQEIINSGITGIYEIGEAYDKHRISS